MQPVVLSDESGRPGAPHRDHRDGLLEAPVRDGGSPVPCGRGAGLVDDPRQVGAAHAGRLAGDRDEVDVGRQRLALGVHGQDLLAPPAIRRGHLHLTVEPARAGERRVEEVRAVRGGEDDDLAADEPVHLVEQRDQGVLALAVATAHPGARGPGPADGVDLVDEDDGGAGRAGAVEQVADPLGAAAGEDLDEVAAGDREERHPGLARDRAREQGLAGAGRADEQGAARRARAHRLEPPAVAQELDDLAELRDGLVGAGHVGEPVDRHLADLLAALPVEAADPAGERARLRQVEQEPGDEQHRQAVRQQAGDDAVAG